MSKQNLSNDNWYHLVAIYDHDSGKQELYINGYLDNYAYIGNFQLCTNDQNFLIGRGSHGQPFNGIIAELQILNRSISINEVQESYIIGRTMVDNNTVLCLNMNEGDGNKVYDKSGLWNDGIIIKPQWTTNTSFRTPYINRFNASLILIPEAGEIELQMNVSVVPLLVNNNVEVLSWYKGDQGIMPFVARIRDNNIEFIYINIFPLVRTILLCRENESCFYQTLEGLSYLLGKYLPVYDTSIIPQIMGDETPYLIFKEASLKGNIKVQLTSIIFPYKINLDILNSQEEDCQLSLYNITSIWVKNGNISISTQELGVIIGKGFYSSLVANGMELLMKGESLYFTMDSENGSTVEIVMNPNITISTKDQVHFYARNTFIQNDGKTEFKETYGIHSYLANLRISGETLILQGNVKFNIIYSDEYSFAVNPVLYGIIERQPPLIQWDELGSMKKAFLIIFFNFIGLSMLTRIRFLLCIKSIKFFGKTILLKSEYKK